MIADVGVYAAGSRVPCGPDLDSALEHWLAHEDRFIWIGLVEPTVGEMAPIVGALGLHPLAVEDAVHGQQRPKLELYGEELLVVCKHVHYVDPSEVVEIGDLLAFVGCRYVVTVRHGPGLEIARLRKQLEADPGRLVHGPAEILHALLDFVVDSYAPAMTGLEDDVTEIQERVFGDAGVAHTKRIFLLKREVLSFRQAALPLRGPLSELSSRPFPPVPEHMRPYFRDVEDHLLRTGDRLTGIDALLSSALDANIAQVGVQQNEDMRKMSAWLAIGAVPTVVGAVYGMNFQHMPELGWRYGYLFALAIIAALCGLLYFNFKRRGWL